MRQLFQYWKYLAVLLLLKYPPAFFGLELQRAISFWLLGKQTRRIALSEMRLAN